ncbi:MAG TPA: TIGR01212 family radical SAM protein [Treponema sp.]|nr:TIGR01212 family radical SAM protein [Treponema sp.]
MTRRFLSDYLRETFGCKVYKLSLSSGCTCPNRDGTVGWGGCVFCSAGGSGDFATSFEDVNVQIEKAKLRVDGKFPKSTSKDERKYIAYFQSFTATHAPAEKLEPLFDAAISRNDIVSLSIGTRPDCLPPETVALLSRLNRRKPVWVELGLQTVHEKTAAEMNRCFTLDVFEKAYADLKNAGLTVIVHVILGLPGESRDDMLETVRYLSELNPTLDGIKLHLLHVLEGTALAEIYRKKNFHIFTLEEYCTLVADCLDLLPSSTVVHRMTGDGPKKILVAPLWSGDKKRVMNALKAELASRGQTKDGTSP